MRTVTVKPDDIQRKWYVVDAENKILGRLATQIAHRLRGKHKPEFTPNMDLGDYIIVINASKVRVTGNKTEDKMYYHHSRYPGGLKSTNFAKLQKRHPEDIIKQAVKGMLPKGPLGRKMAKKLKVYAGTEHEHAAQQPEILNIETE
ncbi:MAG: 50S ribosomal protein L13 [Pseudomonadota bacterium]|nr:50S ribosomal protein L13 [Gammaproteobacteria bacterium]MBU1558343.1 50S ribosomal protein L13 [Gammaproteobacteria bacterium]MBU1628831.1 50S ribosomal protein L13 [Gammaproteobacteria bacterium]MBU1926462.1 50S ribosomal protein L13 [Gammaproteobacteria bacterium]MBU2545653.1 50S ribosomal protein L13 [Gammaproteobacteria bacterium]